MSVDRKMSFDNDRIHCLCNETSSIGMRQMCGVIIDEVQLRDEGPWRCHMRVKNRNVRIKKTVNLVIAESPDPTEKPGTIIKIKPNTLIDTISDWCDTFVVMFQLKLYDYKDRVNILHFDAGDAPAPSISTLNNNRLIVRMFLDNKVRKFRMKNIRTNRWYSILISQEEENGQVLYALKESCNLNG